MASTLTNQGIYLAVSGRTTEAAAYHREAARIADQHDPLEQGRALINLSDVLGRVDPSASLEAAREAIELLCRTGDRGRLAFAVINAVIAELEVGAWDDAERTITTGIERYGLEDDSTLSVQAWIAAMRGHDVRAVELLDGFSDMRASEDAQDRAGLALVAGFVAAAQHRPGDVLRHGRRALDHLATLGPSTDVVRWAWGLAARAAHELNDLVAERELLALLDPYRPGQLGRLLSAERDLCIARLAVGGEADALFKAAMGGLRDRSTPYHVAHGLLDYASFLTTVDRGDEAAALVEEARRIGEQLQAAVVLERVASATAQAVPVST
jgi:hypothetical protein